MVKQIVFFLSLCPFIIMGQETPTITSSIQIEVLNQGMVSISGVCFNETLTDHNLHYTLNIQKKTVSDNINNNKQSGDFTLKIGERKALSTTTINFDPQDFTKITLSVYNDKNTLVARQEKLLNETDLLKK